MYVLARLEDRVRIPPHVLRADGEVEGLVRAGLNRKYGNKVVVDVGLCVCLYDVEGLGDAEVEAGDGGVHVHARFRLVVFRPFVEEVLLARIRSSSKLGLQLSLGFFDDLWVPADKLRPDSRWKEADGAWVWEYEAEEGQPPAELFLDKGALVRCRVVKEVFRDTKPSAVPDPATASAAQPPPNPLAEAPGLAPEDSRLPYHLIASMAEDGLGCVAWWTPQEDAQEDPS